MPTVDWFTSLVQLLKFVVCCKFQFSLWTWVELLVVTRLMSRGDHGLLKRTTFSGPLLRPMALVVTGLLFLVKQVPFFWSFLFHVFFPFDYSNSTPEYGFGVFGLVGLISWSSEGVFKTPFLVPLNFWFWKQFFC